MIVILRPDCSITTGLPLHTRLSMAMHCQVIDFADIAKAGIEAHPPEPWPCNICS